MKSDRVISIVLMLLMLTPSMVCFMAACPEKAHAAAEKPEPPCHGFGKETKSSSGPMLMEDCMQNDLGQVSSFDMPLPDMAMALVVFMIPLIASNSSGYRSVRLSGADPPIKARASFHRILITQRILQ